MKDVTWFFRGVQSAIFLYVSCGPCYGAAAKRRRRKEAKQSREEKARLRETDPVAPHQPAPFEINPYWQEEIEAGPGPPARRVKKPKPKAATSTLPEIDGSAIETGLPSGPISPLQPGAKLEAKMEQYRDRIKNFDPAHIKESWHNRRQRRDEEYTSDDEPDDGVGSSLPRHMRRPGQTTKPRQPSRYYISKAPPVNDLHPPIVCTPSPYPSERRWMKEPPPSAAFMAGREGARNSGGRSRAGSRASTTPRTHQPSPRLSSVSLGRQVTSRAVEERIRRGLTDVDALSASQVASGRMSSQSATSLQASSDNVRVMDYADVSTPSSSFDIQRRGGASSSRSRRRRRETASRGDESSDTETEEITPTTTTTTVNSLPKLEATHLSTDSSAIRRFADDARRSRRVSKPESTVSRSTIDADAHMNHARSENTSPALSAQRSSPPASPIPFQARALSASIISAPVSPLLEPTSDDRSNTDALQPIVSVKDFSLDVLQELISPSSALNARKSRSPPPDARVKLRRSDTGNGIEHEPGAYSDGDDGWLWTESGERRWKDQKQARDVRNRWSIDF